MVFPSHAAQCCKESHSVKDYEVQDYLVEEWHAKLIKLELKRSPGVNIYCLTYQLTDDSELELHIVLDSNLKFKRHNWRVH